MIVEAHAPTRVDFAGSTIDIWPLWVFHPGALTINIAVEHRARVRVAERDDAAVAALLDRLTVKNDYSNLIWKF